MHNPSQPLEYYSQSGQDRFVDEHVFNGRTGGFFVDIGAYDGVHFSNSYFFEKHRGWNGVCVEPMPEAFANVDKTRQCIKVNACIAAQPGTVEFTVATGGQAAMFSGISDRMSDEHRQRIADTVAQTAGTVRTIKVQAVTFADIMARAGRRDIDYLSIDTEGMELEILRTIDFNQFPTRCLTVEYNGKFREIRAMLKGYGFVLVEKLAADLLFVHQSQVQQMRRVGFLRPGAFQARVAKAMARRIRRAVGL